MIGKYSARGIKYGGREREWLDGREVMPPTQRLWLLVEIFHQRADERIKRVKTVLASFHRRTEHGGKEEEWMDGSDASFSKSLTFGRNLTPAS